MVALGTLDGVLDLLPKLKHATKAFNAVADAKNSFTKALNNTRNCGESGSSIAFLNTGKGYSNLAKAFFGLADNLSNQTSDKSGQLRLVSGNLKEVTDQIGISANALEALAGYINTLTDNIDTESLAGSDQLIPIYKELLNSSKAFNKALTSVAQPSRLLLKLVSISFVTGFTDAVDRTKKGFRRETAALKSAESRCGVSTGLVQPLNDLGDIVETIHNNLLILGQIH